MRPCMGGGGILWNNRVVWYPVVYYLDKKNNKVVNCIYSYTVNFKYKLYDEGLSLETSSLLIHRIYSSPPFCYFILHFKLPMQHQNFLHYLPWVVIHSWFIFLIWFYLKIVCRLPIIRLGFFRWNRHGFFLLRNALFVITKFWDCRQFFSFTSSWLCNFWRIGALDPWNKI